MSLRQKRGKDEEEEKYLLSITHLLIMSPSWHVRGGMLNERAKFLWMIINFDTFTKLGGNVSQKVTADDNLDVLRFGDIFFSVRKLF